MPEAVRVMIARGVEDGNMTQRLRPVMHVFHAHVPAGVRHTGVTWVAKQRLKRHTDGWGLDAW